MSSLLHGGLFPSRRPGMNTTTAASMPTQPSAMSWLCARAAAALGLAGVRQQPLVWARAVATQTPALGAPQQSEPPRPGAAVADHPVLLMARLQRGKALDLDDVRRDEEVSAHGAAESRVGKSDEDEAASKTRRSDAFIGCRLPPVRNEGAWAEASVVLNESPFLSIRPTTDQLIGAHLIAAKPIPGVQRWGRGRREQDRALAELKLALAQPPSKRQGSNARGPRPHASTSASSDRTNEGEGGDAGGIASFAGGSRGGRRGAKRGREQDAGKATAAAAAYAAADAAAAAPTTAGTVMAVAAAVRTKGSTVVVTEDDDIVVDGVAVCAHGDLCYSRLFGKAQLEKFKDPARTIANGLVDRCYYRGRKRGQAAPGVDFFPTDKAMLAEYVRRTPNAVLEVLSS